MALPDVKVLAGKGSANQSAPGQDYYSGLIYYTNTLPSGFTSSSRIKQLFSVADAITAGIKNDYSDETQATFHLPISAIGSTGNVIVVNYANPITGLTDVLATYAQKSTDTTATILGASLALAITNNQSVNGGYTATSTTGTLLITVKKGLGITPNTGTPLSTTITGTITVGSIALVTSGVASLLYVWYYHISEYFRLNPFGNLHVSFNAIPANAASYTYVEVSLMQTFANGIIRNFAVYAPKNYAAGASDVLTFITASTGLLQTQYTAIFNGKTPGQILFSTDLMKLTNISNLTLDLSTLTNNRTSVIISQDGANLGHSLFLQTGYSITDIGATLGVMSAALVSDDIGDLSQFNLTNGTELSVPAFGTGELNKNLSGNLLTQLDLFRYIFNLIYVGYTGVFKNNDHTATSVTDEFAYIHYGRTWDKASRLLYVAYLPFLKAKLALNAAGNLTPQTQATLVEAGNTALDVMVRNTELSGYTVVVPANQNPNITGKLAITVNLLAEAIANEIDITSQFVASL